MRDPVPAAALRTAATIDVGEFVLRVQAESDDNPRVMRALAAALCRAGARLEEEVRQRRVKPDAGAVAGDQAVVVGGETTAVECGN